MVDIPPWLKTMRDITGIKEVAGGADNPLILKWCTEISVKFPALAAYCRTYTHDSIPWCGLCVAYVMAHNGIRPIDGFLWAANWAKFGKKLDKPVLGCVMVFTRDGGGHVTLYEGEDETHYIVRGGNQSDAVNVSRYPKSRFTAAVWPNVIAVPLPKPAPARRRFTGITATIFKDPAVAYPDVKPGWNERLGVSLPFRFKGKRQDVRVFYQQQAVVCPVIDVGPWNTDDSYWTRPDGRPQAESGIDKSGRRTNLAGIDLTPATARKLGLIGKAKVDWEFVPTGGGNIVGAGTAVIIGAGGAVAANEAQKAGHHPALIGMGFALVVAIAITGFFLVRKWMRS